MIMLVGVMTVFMALFLIILFLLGFPGFFAALRRKKHGGPAPLPQIVEVTKKTPVATEPAPHEDESLIAVLTAAIAAASGTKPDSFAITHMHQTPAEDYGSFNTPVWGRVERLARK